MNKKELTLALKACAYAGLKVRHYKSFFGSKGWILGICYNKAGDTRPFNVWSNYGAAIELAQSMGICIDIQKNECRTFFTKESKDHIYAVNLSGITDKKRELKICKLLVNSVLYIGREKEKGT